MKRPLRTLSIALAAALATTAGMAAQTPTKNMSNIETLAAKMAPSPFITNAQMAPPEMQQPTAKQVDDGKTTSGYINALKSMNGHINFVWGGGSGGVKKVYAGEAMTTKALASPDGDGVQRMSASVEIDDKFTGKHLFGGAIAGIKTGKTTLTQAKVAGHWTDRLAVMG